MRPRLYAELADWWALVSPVADYEGEAKLYAELLRDGRAATPLAALELGSGGGHCAFHLCRGFLWTLSDVSPEMLAQCRRRHPHAVHELGDMRTMRLHRQFDAVFVHDAIAYMTTPEELEAACRTAFEHCRPGAVALFVPDCLRETFAAGTDHGGADGEGRSLRFLEWTHEPAPGGHRYRVDFAFLLREGDQVRIVHDHHEWGVFARGEWLQLLARVGFVAAEHRIAEPDGERIAFVARRPAR